ncbi:unnamed protein product [Blepharisma stoltei]|uniref:Uncharacterized protein n=1 Tax=Blepharisma stoltei TaxID=1481888 RepID=A0AAU9I8W3_9CILI|nr:unnamed protein product [Blepharisma stoltei]
MKSTREQDLSAEIKKMLNSPSKPEEQTLLSIPGTIEEEAPYKFKSSVPDYMELSRQLNERPHRLNSFSNKQLEAPNSLQSSTQSKTWIPQNPIQEESKKSILQPQEWNLMSQISENRKPLVFPNYLKEGLRKYLLKEDHLNYQGIVAVFELNYSLLDEQRQVLEDQEEDLFLILQYGGFRVISRCVKVLLQEEFQQINLYGSRPVTQAFQPLQSMLTSTLTRNSSMLQNLNKTRATVLNDKLNDPYLLLCISSTSYVNSQVQFNKFMKAAAELIPKAFKLVYASKNSVQGLTDTCLFFPEVFAVKHSCILMIPGEEKAQEVEDLDPILAFFQKQSNILKGKSYGDENGNPNEQNLEKLIDILSFNGHVAISSVCKKTENQAMEQVLAKIMEKPKVNAFMRYLLSSNTDSKLFGIAAGKAGVPFLLSMNPFSTESFWFTSEKEAYELYKYFFPQLSSTSRTIIAFRPLAVRSGLDKVLISIFKSNYFVILRETYKKLTIEEAMLLKRSTISMTPESEQDYLNYMLEGETHIVAMSKFGAIENAKILSDGCRFGRKRSEKRLLGVEKLSFWREKELINPFHIKLEEEEGFEKVQENRFIREDIITVPSNGESGLFNMWPFSSINELIDLDAIAETEISGNEFMSDRPNFYKRASEIERMREFSRSFNVLAECSESIEAAESQIDCFFPDLQNYSELVVSFKPEALTLKEDALELIKDMQFSIIKYHVVSEASQYLFITKKAAFEEVISALDYKALVSQPLGPQHLNSLFEMVIGSQNKQDIIRMICPNLASFSGEILLQAPDNVKNEVLRYCCLTTIGEEPIIETIQPVLITCDFPHTSYKMKSKIGFSEVRIRRIGSLEGKDSLEDRLSLINEYEITKWYYKQIRKMDPEIVPSYFQYIIEPNDPEIEVSRVFTNEQYKGDVFLYEVSEVMKKNRDRERAKNAALLDQPRGSISVFMWGRNLALLAEKIENIRCDIVEDCGPLYWDGKGAILGILDDITFWELERQKYMNALNDLKIGWENYIPANKAQSIEKTLIEILESFAFQESRAMSNVALVPEIVDYINLRIFSHQKEARDLAKNIGKNIDQQRSLLAELRGQDTAKIDLKEIALVDVQPAKYHKRHMAANIIWLLNLYLKKLDRQLLLLCMNADEYDAMLESLHDGFIKNYQGDVGIKGISLLKMEYFLFSFWQAWKTSLAMRELDDRRRQIIASRDNSIRTGRGAFKDIVSKATEEVKFVTYEAERLDYELTLHLENLYKIDITYVPPEGPYPGQNKIDNQRYFRHFGLEEYEKNLSHPDYPDILIQNKFPKVSQELISTIGRGLSAQQARWANPPPFLKYNLRPVPDSAYRWDGTLVKSTKWVTHERSKKMVSSAILQLLNELPSKSMTFSTNK